jgi:hypothetical protein
MALSATARRSIKQTLGSRRRIDAAGARHSYEAHMATITQLQARLERLKKLQANGLRGLSHGDTRTEFRSLDEITRAIGLVEEQIAAAGGTQVPRTYKLTSSKDL